MELDKLKEGINQLYFGILQTNKQWTQLQFTKLDIKERHQKSRSSIEKWGYFQK
ncbi:hypothetical protein [Cloacibacterium normanense]